MAARDLPGKEQEVGLCPCLIEPLLPELSPQSGHYRHHFTVRETETGTLTTYLDIGHELVKEQALELTFAPVLPSPVTST